MQDRIDRSHSEQPGLQTGVKGASKSAVADFDAFLGRSRASPASVRRRRVYPLTALQPRLLGHSSDQCSPASLPPPAKTRRRQARLTYPGNLGGCCERVLRRLLTRCSAQTWAGCATKPSLAGIAPPLASVVRPSTALRSGHDIGLRFAAPLHLSVLAPHRTTLQGPLLHTRHANLRLHMRLNVPFAGLTLPPG